MIPFQNPGDSCWNNILASLLSLKLDTQNTSVLTRAVRLSGVKMRCVNITVDWFLWRPDVNYRSIDCCMARLDLSQQMQSSITSKDCRPST